MRYLHFNDQIRSGTTGSGECRSARCRSDFSLLTSSPSQTVRPLTCHRGLARRADDSHPLAGLKTPVPKPHHMSFIRFFENRTRTKEHQSEEVLFDVKLLNTLRHGSPRFVVWPRSCREREVEKHSQERVQAASHSFARKFRSECDSPRVLS